MERLDLHGLLDRLVSVQREVAANEGNAVAGLTLFSLATTMGLMAKNGLVDRADLTDVAQRLTERASHLPETAKYRDVARDIADLISRLEIGTAR